MKKCPICNSNTFLIYGNLWDYDVLICSTSGCEFYEELHQMTILTQDCEEIEEVIKYDENWEEIICDTKI